jgi:hypothetical protein
MAASPSSDRAQRRRVRRSAWLLTFIAAAFYFGFIAMMLMRGAR